ncbi:FecR domain-containing protein [Nanoarchaeota archaeon]
MGWLKKLTLVFLIVIILALGIVGYIGYSLTQGYTITAFLVLQEGGVYVDSGGGWSPAHDGMELSENDKVKTENAAADVVLYESVIVSLDPNTEITISDLAEDHPKVDLNYGSIWNKFTGLVGVSNYDVQTPTTVATVRGTEFGTSFIDGITEVIVGEGSVTVTSEGQSTDVEIYQRLKKAPDMPFEIEQLSPEEVAALKQRKERVLVVLKRVRLEEIDKNDHALKIAGSYGASREDIVKNLHKVDSGEVDDRELANKITGMSPVKIASVDKLLAIDDEIKQQINDIKELEYSK